MFPCPQLLCSMSLVRFRPGDDESQDRELANATEIALQAVIPAGRIDGILVAAIAC